MPHGTHLPIAAEADGDAVERAGDRRTAARRVGAPTTKGAVGSQAAVDVSAERELREGDGRRIGRQARAATNGESGAVERTDPLGTHGHPGEGPVRGEHGPGPGQDLAEVAAPAGPEPVHAGPQLPRALVGERLETERDGGAPPGTLALQQERVPQPGAAPVPGAADRTDIRQQGLCAGGLRRQRLVLPEFGERRPHPGAPAVERLREPPAHRNERHPSGASVTSAGSLASKRCRAAGERSAASQRGRSSSMGGSSGGGVPSKA